MGEAAEVSVRVSLGTVLRMHAAYLTPLSMREVGRQFGIGKSAVARAFREWGLPVRAVGGIVGQFRAKPERNPKPSIAVIPRFQPPRSWCGQCERRVSSAEAGQCGSRFCRAGQTAIPKTQSPDKQYFQGAM